MKSILGEKGQVTIPKALRESLGLSPGQALEFQEKKGVLLLKKIPNLDPLLSLVGLAKNKSKPTDDLLSEMRGPPFNPKLDRKK